MESIQFFQLFSSLVVSVFFFRCCWCSALILWIGASTDFTFFNFSLLFFRSPQMIVDTEDELTNISPFCTAICCTMTRIMRTHSTLFTQHGHSDQEWGKQVFFVFYFVFFLCVLDSCRAQRNANNVCALSWFIDLTLVYCHFIFTIEWATEYGISYATEQCSQVARTGDYNFVFFFFFLFYLNVKKRTTRCK